MNRTVDMEVLDQVLGRPGQIAVCVVTGTPGIGKTALAVHWAHRVRQNFADGQLYVNLRGYDAEEPIPPERALGGFLTALGVAPGARTPRSSPGAVATASGRPAASRARARPAGRSAASRKLRGSTTRPCWPGVLWETRGRRP